MEWKKVTELFSWRRGGLRRRLLWIGLLFLGVALITNTLAGSLYSRRQIKKSAAQLQAEVASRVATKIEEFMERKVERLLDFSVTASIHEFGGEEQRLLSLLLLKNDRAFTEMAILDDMGMELLKVSERRVYLPTEFSDQSGSEKFEKAISGENYSSPVYFSDKAEPYVTLAVPLKSTPAEITGVVSAEANLRFLWQVIGDVEFSIAGYAYVVDSQGNLIAHRDPSLVLKRMNLSHLPQVQEFLRNPGGTDPTPAEERQGIMGQPVLSTFAQVHGLGWAVIVGEPLDLALADIKRLERYAFLLLGVGLLLGAVIIVWVSKRITEPIRELHKGVEVIGRGNLDHRVEIKTGDEIEQLAQEFNKMAVELKTFYATLEQKVEQRTKELSVLYDVTTTVNQSLEIEPVLQEVIKKVNEIFHFDATRIFLFNARMEDLELRASFSPRTAYFAEIRSFRRGQGIVGRAADTSEPIIFEDIETDPRYEEWTQTKASKRAGFRFFAAFPIRTKERPAGAILFIGQFPRRVSPDEVRLLTSMAEQIAVAVENAWLHQETVTRARELSALYDVTATVNQSLEIEPVLQEVIRKITEIFNFDTMRLYLFDGQMEVLHVRAAYPADREDLPRVRAFRRGQGIVGKVAETGEPMIFEDILSDSRYRELSSTKNTQMTGFRFFAAVPIKSKFKIVGVFICNGQTPRRLTSDEVRLVTSMAEEIGVAVEHARLFEEVTRKSQELQALVEINKGIAALLDREVLLPRIAEEARNLLKMDGANFRLIEGEYLVLVGESRSEKLKYRPRLRLDESLSGTVVKENRVVSIKNCLEDPTLIEEHREVMRAAGYHSFLGVPLRVGRRVIGTINFNSKEEREFQPEEIKLITSFADQAAIAIQNANLFAEVKQKTAELEGANRGLVEASRAKSEFMAAMSHELRTPLNVIIGNADLIKDGFFGDLTEKQREALEKILRYSQMLLKLINDVLALTRMEAKKMRLDLSTFRVEQIIDNIQAYADQLDHEKHLEFLWDIEENLPPMTTDALKLEEILQNLLGNAFKFTPDGGIEIRVRNLRGKGRVEFTVADTGIGIERDALDKIFEQFYQFRDAHTGSYSGVGLGLSIVKKYLEIMQGDIHVESQPKKGSTFTFSLPYSLSASLD